MRLILLRHEERDQANPLFYSSLTPDGMANAELLGYKLLKYDIDVIFSSPFLRTLQTIYPYCRNTNKKVNVEYGIYEYIHNLMFTKDNYYHDISEYKVEYPLLWSIINKSYKSVCDGGDIEFYENEMSLQRRIIKFFDELIPKYHDKTVLIVSHMGIINRIKDIYSLGGGETRMNKYFPMGHYEVYDIN